MRAQSSYSYRSFWAFYLLFRLPRMPLSSLCCEQNGCVLPRVSGRLGRAQDEAKEESLLRVQQLPNLQLCNLGEAGAGTLSSLRWIDGCATCRTGPCLL